MGGIISIDDVDKDKKVVSGEHQQENVLVSISFFVSFYFIISYVILFNFILSKLLYKISLGKHYAPQQ